MVLLANVILPAFQAAYAAWAFVPAALVAVTVEAVLLRRFNLPMTLRRALALAAGANVVSALAGVWLSPLLLVGSGLVVPRPDSTGFGVLAHGPHWPRLALLGFAQAAAVSAAIELAVLWPVRRVVGLRRVVVPVLLGNAASYLVLLTGFAAVFGGMLTRR